MQCRKLYLEAPRRTQDLSTMKWTMHGKGYTVGSTWHEDPRAGLAVFDGHWGAQRLAEMQETDALVVLAGESKENVSLAAMAALALALGLKVIWIGLPVEALSGQNCLAHFATVAEFYQQEANSPEWLFAKLQWMQAA